MTNLEPAIESKLKVCNSLIQKINELTATTDILEAVKAGIIEIFGSETSTTITTFVGGTLIEQRLYAGKRFTSQKPLAPRPDGLTAQVRKNGELVFIGDVANHSQMKPSIKADGVTAAIFAPIKIGGLVLGVLYIDTLSEAGFIDYDGYLLTTLAYHVANVLRSSRHKRRSDLLSGLVYHLDLTQPIQTLLDAICRQAGALFQVDEASIQIYRAPETSAQQPERYPTLTLGLWQRDGQSTISLPAISQQFLETFKRNDTICIENDTPAAAYAPIRIEDETYGVLAVRTAHSTDIFLEDDTQYLDALAHIVSLIIRSFEFNEQLKQIIDIAPIGVMAIGKQGRVTLVSEVTRRLLDYSEGLPTAFNVQDVYAGGRAAARNIKSYIEEAPDGILRNYRATLRAADGSSIPTNITATQFKRLNGEQVGGFGFFYDHREQEVLNGIAGLVINDHQPADLFARMTLIIARALYAQSCGLFYFDNRSNNFAVYGQFGLSSVSEIPSDSIIHEVFSKGDVLAFSKNKPQQETTLRSLRQDLQLPRLDNGILLPLSTQNRTVAVLLVANKDKRDDDDFSEADRHLLHTIVPRIVTLIQNVEQTRAMQALQDISAEVVAAEDEKQALQLIVDTLVTQLNYKLAYFRFLRPDRTLNIAVTAGTSYDYLADPNYILPVDTGIAGRVLSTGQYAMRIDLNQPEQGLPQFFFPDIINREKVRGLICVPVSFNQQVIGILSCYTGHPCHFSDKDAHLLQTFANLGAAAKINTQAFTALTQLHSASEWMMHADSLQTALQQIYENVPTRVTGDGVFVIPCTDNYQRLDFKRAAGIGLGQSAVLWENSARQHESLREALVQYEVIHVPDINVPSGEVYLSRQTRDNFIRAGIFGFIGVPLFSSAGNTLQGILFVNYRSATSLALLNQDETLLKIYADLAAIALERARSQERAARERALLASLASITATSSSVKEICQFILNEAVAHAGATQGNISRILPNSTILRDVARHGAVWVGAAQDLDFSQTSEQGVQGYVAHNKESVLIHDVRAPEWQHIYVTGNPDTRSELTVPLLVGKDGELMGVLNLESTETYAFSDWDQSLMEALALHAALAIQNGDRREKLTEYNERFKAIANSFHLSRELNDRETMLQAILEMAASKTGATIATIQKIVGDQLSLESVYPPELKSIVRAQIGDALPLDGPGITVAVANQGIPIRVGNVRSETIYLDGTRGRSAAELAIPLFHNNIVWGVLNVESARFNAFSDDDAILLSAIGNIAINALQGRKYARELSRTNTVALIGTWGAQIFHDVNRAMRDISFGIKGIRRIPDLAESIDEPLRDIQSILKKLYLPADLSALPLPGETIDDKTDVEYCLRQILRSQEDELGQLQIQLRQSFACDGAEVAIHVRWLSFIMQHLINNAKRYVPQGNGLIEISAQLAEDKVIIRVADNGSGIDPSIRHLIFSEPINKTAGEKGGLGLLLVGFMTDVHLGHYRIIYSDKRRGTCIEIGLPVASTNHSQGEA